MASEPLPPQLAGYSPTPHEKQAYAHLFTQADKDQLGVLTGDTAVPFFSHSALPALILGEVWQLADPDNAGFLSPDRFGVACRLIGHAQDRRKRGAAEVRPEWVAQPGPLPTFKGYPLPASIHQPTPPTSPPPAPPAAARQSSLPPTSPANNTSASLSHISPHDKAKYARVFANANGGNVTGQLDGEKARDIWVKSQLPYDVLGQIWNLADTHSRGALDLTDFTIGMHLLHLVLDGTIPASALPAVLDPKLYAAAAGLPTPALGQQQQQQPQQQPPQSPLRQSSLPAPAPVAPSSPAPAPTAQAQSSAQQWAITPTELQESNTWFDSLDAQSGRKGRIDGEQAVAFFGQSGLPVEKLAKVWDLSDLNNEGHLSRETFAVAMHLLKRALASPAAPLPDSLPADLVPPSMRQQQQVVSQPQRDLLDLLDDDEPASAPAPAPVLQPQSTGASRSLSPQPQTQPRAAMSLSPQPTGGSASAFTLRGTVFPQATGEAASTPTAATAARGGFESHFSPSPAPAPKTSATFFDDNDDADLASSAQQLESRVAERRAEAEQAEGAAAGERKTRAALEADVAQLTADLSALEARIASARETHAAERARVDELRARLAAGRETLERARGELIRAESDVSALRIDKREVEGEVLRDRDEARDLLQRVKLVEDEKRILRDELEKVKKERRQGKGRAAIARKQLSQAEADRDRLERERDAPGPADDDEPGSALDEARAAATALTAPVAQAAAVPLPATPAAAVASPAASVRSTNPFDRFTAASPAGGLSPQSTGAGSTNPFAFAAASPATPQEPREPEQKTKEDESSGGTSLPVAAAAAVGTGALAALGAAGAGIAHAFSGSGDDHHDGEKKDAQDKDPFGVPVPASLVGASEAQSEHAQAPPSTAADGFGDDFSAPASAAEPKDAAADGFGDDFSATPVPVGESSAPGFDDEFAALDEPRNTAAAEPPVEGSLGDVAPDAGFTDAVRDLNDGKGPDAVQGTLGEVDSDAGFDEAFDEVREKEDKGKGKERAVEPDEEGDVFGQSAAAADTSRDEDEGDSSSDDGDEDEGPEEAFGAHRRAEYDEDQADGASSVSGGFATPAAASTDLGTSSPPDIAATMGASSSEPPADGPVAAGHDATGSTHTASREPTTNSESGESFVHVNVGPAGTAESETMLEPPAPASFQPPSPTPAATPPAPSHRRAAPPPPTQRGASPAAAPAVVPPAAAVDNGFGDAFAPTSQAPAAQDAAAPPPAAPAAEDDFESSFADMTSSTSTAPVSTPAPTTAAGSAVDFDSFDNDFTFDEASASAAATNAHNAAQVKSDVAGTSDFDEAAFADFDSSFPGSAPTGTAGKDNDDAAFAAFDDSFGTPAPAATLDAGPPALGKPVEATYAPPPGPPPPLAGKSADASLPPTPAMSEPSPNPQEDDMSGDSDAVKTIRQMGFSREQALEALKKFDDDVNRAANSLLGM
ncbi:hypothetical protein Rhopal_007799-T1 [Rhodotorula paludigena]|uniref:Uncharacterized protein n=1 Tax=Rhodotorula paludigena TaxID=86838 RepID=A0AAV5GWP0_9BASI|nr:hypothetical protein Rhopal_007799-T1 [Rhodotorula paludigena]